MLAGVASVASAFTLDTSLVKTEDGSSVSAYAAALDQTTATVSSVSGISEAGKLYFQSGNMPTVTLTLGDMFGADALSGSTLTLSTLSFLSRPDESYFGYGTVTVSVNGDSVTSSSYNTNVTTGNDSYRAVVWTFTDALTFTTQDSLTVTFTKGTTNVGMGSFQTATGYTFGGVNPVYTSGSNQYYNFFRLEVIPEPAAATLSLLALAGLAARRRRQ